MRALATASGLLVLAAGHPVAPPIPAVAGITAPQRIDAVSPSSANAEAQAARVTLAFIHSAMARSEYEIVQLRRVRDGGREGSWVGLRERLAHDLDASGEERFSLELLGLEGRLLTPTELAIRQDAYEDQAGYIHRYQSFRVHDLEAAETSYRIYRVVDRERIGRPVERIIVYPALWDRSAWLLDVDRETGYPLYCREYNIRGQVLSELIVEEFYPQSTSVTEASRWRPASTVTSFPTVSGAVAHVAAGRRLREVRISGLPGGYRDAVVEVVEDLLTGEQSVVTCYSDGVDTVFMVQTPQLEGVPWPVPTADGMHTVLQYRDLNVAQYVFYADETRFVILGRSSLEDLRLAVEDLYRQAIR